MALESVPAEKPDALVAFDVVDVLGRFTTLGRRTPTLDGGVPIRVAQGCVPLLEGNAWGWQLSLSRRLAFKRRLGGWYCEGADEIDRRTRAAIPMLLRDRTLRPGAWVKRLERGAIDTARSQLSVFTGLFVRPREGWRLRVSTLGNRRALSYRVDEAILDDTSALTPLFVDLAPARDVPFTIEGEIATLGVLPARTTFTHTTIDGAPDIARAHVAFYDERYFATKRRGEVARKYRDDIVRAQRSAPSADSVEARVVTGGPSLVDTASPVRVHRATGPAAAPAEPDRLVVRNAVSLTATFDGYTLAVEPDRSELEHFATDVRATWQRWATATGTPFHEGALLYLTKYITPHPPGEPHFFVKPPVLIATSPGTSTVIDGVGGGSYDVMRGVVRSDAFHAVPAVFQLWRPGEPIRVARGAVLAELFVTPRSLDDTTFDASTAGPAGGWT